MKEEYLIHWGILGMKWGIRRYQNPDGTLTEAGKKRYNNLYDKTQESQRNFNNSVKKQRSYSEYMKLYKKASDDAAKFNSYLNKTTGYREKFKDLNRRYTESRKSLIEQKATDIDLDKNAELFLLEQEELMDSSIRKLGFQKGSREYDIAERFLSLNGILGE